MWSKVLPILVAVVVAVAVGFGMSFVLGDDGPSQEGPGEDPEIGGNLYYYEIPTGTIVRRVVDTGEEEVLARDIPQLRGGSLSPGARWFAYVPLDEQGRFVLHLLDLETGETKELGLGAPPVWHPDGDRFMYQVYGGGQQEDAPIAVAREENGFEPEVILGPTNYFPAGWSGDRIAMVDVNAGRAALLTPGERPEVFDDDVSGLWGVSPRGDAALTVTPDADLHLVHLTGGAPEKIIPVDGGLVNGAWSPDGELALVPVSQPDAAESRLMLFDPAAGVMRPLPAEGSPTGYVFWAPSSERFTYGSVQQHSHDEAEAHVHDPETQRVCDREYRCRDVLVLSAEVVPLGVD